MALLGGVGTLAALTGTAKEATARRWARRVPPSPRPWWCSPTPPRVGRSTPTASARCRPTGVRLSCSAPRTGAAAGSRSTLPVGVPTTTALWGRLQARGDAVVLPWQYGVYLSDDDGADWTSPTLHGETATLPNDWFVVREGDQLGVGSARWCGGAGIAAGRPGHAAVGPGRVRATSVRGSGTRTGSPSRSPGASPGTTPRSAAKPSNSSSPRRPVTGWPGCRSRLDRTTLGVAGDGGEYPVRGVLVSADAGVTWQARAVTGPPVNGACTVMMADGSLLGVAVDGKQLLRLAPGGTTFVPVSGGPATVPACLSSIDGPGVRADVGRDARAQLRRQDLALGQAARRAERSSREPAARRGSRPRAGTPPGGRPRSRPEASRWAAGPRAPGLTQRARCGRPRCATR